MGMKQKPLLVQFFLGITIDEALNWKEHARHVNKQISRSNGIINRLKIILPRKILLMLYNTLVLPYLSYSLLLWGNTYKTTLDNVYKLQKRTVRNICNVPYTQSTGALFKDLKILTIFDIYNHQLGIFLYKFHHDMLPVSFMDFYHKNSRYHEYNTRFRHYLSQPYYRTVRGHSQIRSIGVHLWNSLPPAIKNSSTLNSFKRKLKYHLLQQ